MDRDMGGAEPEAALREVFGLTAFRPGQREVVESVLAGRPTVAVMPTGAGKSLCYQLPAVVAGGTALVVSPLIALMKDQVDALTARGVPACALTSALAPGEIGARLEDMAAGRLRLAYVAPERFKSPRFTDALGRVASQLSLLAVDEAHCISEWGHDFRPDYMRLGEVVERWRPPRVVALTATATPEVRRDIQKQLGLRDPAVFVRGFDRPNLHFSVERVGGASDKTERLRALVRARAGPTLVYAATRKNAEAYAAELAKKGVRARPYHAGLPDGERRDTQDAFMAGELDAVVATNAFGMGVDKADVRLVIHADLPRSPEAYYQEAGRGGRDGQPARCVLLFNHGDVKLQEFLIDANAPSVDLLRAVWRAIRVDPRCGAEPNVLRRALPGSPSEAALATASRFLVRAGYLREVEGVLEALHPSEVEVAPAPLDPAALSARADVERQKLRAMVDYAYATGCRRRFVLSYFGDADAASVAPCPACDVCARATQAPLDGADRARVAAVLSLGAHLGGRFGRTRLATLLAAPDPDDRHAEAPAAGALREDGPRYALDLVRALEGAGLLEASRGEYPTISVTSRGHAVLAGAPCSVPMPATAAARRGRKAKAPSARDDDSPLDVELLERLRAFRRQAADREALPAYCVFADRTLEAIARARPRDLKALMDVHGMGPTKLEKYGGAILAAIRAGGAAAEPG
jgi:ATP-dependent DNA helicase RecQ